jgi:parallel beta-helix repeat protein
MDVLRIAACDVFALFLIFLAPPASAATVTVNCPGETIQAAVDAAGPGDTINVTGTCNENVLLPNDKVKVFLQGGGTAVIAGADSSLPVIDIRGKAILVQGFTIKGGRDGIEVHRSANAVINSNVIQNMAAGIVVYEVAFTVITNNMIQNNSQVGVLLHGSASANIGVNSATDSVASPNTIRNNGDGILLSGAAQANIIGNTIRNNSNNGITLNRGAQANIAKNTINANAGQGILAFQGAGANLGGASENSFGGLLPLLKSANSTTSNNGHFGIACGVGAYIAGNLGSLNGNSGDVGFSFDSACNFTNLEP